MDAEEIAALELCPTDSYAPTRYRTVSDGCATPLGWTQAHLRR